MQLGICLTIGDDIDELKKIKNDGADYIETGLWDLGNLSGDQIAEKFENLNRAGLSCPALNGFCRKDLKLTGPDFDKSALSEYTNKMFEKVSNHVKHITIGSGASRTVPEGFKKEEAREPLFVHYFADHPGGACGHYRYHGRLRRRGHRGRHALRRTHRAGVRLPRRHRRVPVRHDLGRLPRHHYRDRRA